MSKADPVYCLFEVKNKKLFKGSKRRYSRKEELMKRLIYVFLAIGLFITGSSAECLTGNGDPLKYISSCELDFNNDGQPDIALLVETLLGRQLIVLMKAEKGYNAFIVSQGKERMHLSCRFGKTISESETITNAKVYKTPGTYIVLYEPEGASIAYFWNGSGFTEVCTGD
jgi:hypothetical protein